MVSSEKGNFVEITEKMLLVIFLNQANARDPLSLVKRTCTLKRGFIYKSLGPIHTRCVWHLSMRQTVALPQRDRKISFYVLMNLQTAASGMSDPLKRAVPSSSNQNFVLVNMRILQLLEVNFSWSHMEPIPDSDWLKVITRLIESN